VKALLIRRPPFSTRVAALPLTLPPRITEGSFFAASPNKTSGPYRLILRGKALSDQQYQKMQTLLRERDVIHMRHVTGYYPVRHPQPIKPLECHGNDCLVEVKETLQKNHPERFRYPPRPPAEQGFTVFGPLNTLRLTEGKGAFSSLRQEIAAPAEMKLQGVQLLGPSEGAMPVPADERGYALDVSVSGKSLVEGVPLSKDESFSLETALLAATTLAGIIGLYFSVVAWVDRSRRREREDSSCV
jgi:hypothetical protein